MADPLSPIIPGISARVTSACTRPTLAPCLGAFPIPPIQGDTLTQAQGPGPYPQPQPQYAPQPPPKKSNAWKWILGVAIGLVVLCGGGLAACAAIGMNAVDSVVDEQNAKKSDVKVTSCNSKPNEILSSVEVGYTIKNSGSSRRTYLVTFAVNDAAGNRLGETVGSSLDLDPGQSTSNTSPVLLDKAASGKISCVVLDVV